MGFKPRLPVLEPLPMGPGQHIADVMADLTDRTVQFAVDDPARFIEMVEERPDLLDHDGVLTAVAAVGGEVADSWLLAALDHRGRREHALDLLLARGDRRVAPKLGKLLRARGSSIPFSAADGLRRFGNLEHIDALLAYAEGAPLGGRERAFDAIESICRRAGAPLPPAHPGWRLIDLDLPQGAQLTPGITAVLFVHKGTTVATASGAEIRAPEDAVIVAIDVAADPPSRRLVLRRHADPRQ